MAGLLSSLIGDYGSDDEDDHHNDDDGLSSSVVIPSASTTTTITRFPPRISSSSVSAASSVSAGPQFSDGENLDEEDGEETVGYETVSSLLPAPSSSSAIGALAASSFLDFTFLPKPTLRQKKHKRKKLNQTTDVTTQEITDDDDGDATKHKKDKKEKHKEKTAKKHKHNNSKEDSGDAVAATSTPHLIPLPSPAPPPPTGALSNPLSRLLPRPVHAVPVSRVDTASASAPLSTTSKKISLEESRARRQIKAAADTASNGGETTATTTTAITEVPTAPALSLGSDSAPSPSSTSSASSSSFSRASPAYDAPPPRHPHPSPAAASLYEPYTANAAYYQGAVSSASGPMLGPSSGPGPAAAAPEAAEEAYVHPSQQFNLADPNTFDYYGVQSESNAAAYAQYGQYGQYGDQQQPEDRTRAFAAETIASALPKGGSADWLAREFESGLRAKGRIINVDQSSLTEGTYVAQATMLAGATQKPAAEVNIKAKFWDASKGAEVGSAKPSSVHKRKHQINSLAYDAKAKELEMNMKRAAGYAARRTASQRYGFR